MSTSDKQQHISLRNISELLIHMPKMGTFMKHLLIQTTEQLTTRLISQIRISIKNDLKKALDPMCTS